MFGATPPPQDEETPFYPRSPYGAAKVYSYWMTKNYREAYGLFAVNGILFNHESVLRKPHFITMKLIQASYAAKLGQLATLEVGSLDSVVDWGYALDYVDAMIRIARHEPSDIFVVATGKPHTVREFARIAFATVDLDADDFLVENAALIQKPRRILIGDASKLRNSTGWKPSLEFDEMVRRMTKEYHSHLQRSSL
jgi:GDPmannose 4,6-dehydratase